MLRCVFRIEEFWDNRAELVLDDKIKHFDVERDYVYELLKHYKIPIIKIYKDIYKRDEK